MLLDELNLTSLCLVTGITLCVGWAGWNALSEYKVRLFFLSNLVGLFFYCGIGYGLFEGVPGEYVSFYAAFIGVYCLSFILVSKYIGSFSQSVSSVEFEEVRLGASVLRVAPMIIAIYLGVLASSLVYPDVIIDRLWTPPAPSIFEWWNEGLGRSLDRLEMFLQTIQSLLFPFFLISIYRVRKSTIATLTLIILPFYIEYCRAGYVGRTALVAIFTLIFVPMWFEHPTYRKRIVLGMAVCSPILLALMYGWTLIRAGEIVDADLSLWQMAGALLLGEASFPLYSEKILQLGQGVDLKQYLYWLITLPIPRVLFPDKPSFQLNFEVAEIVGGMPPGESGFSVILTGPVTESVFIFGEKFFWLHAVFVGALAAVAQSVSSRNLRCVYVYSYFLFTFSFVFARAGVGGLIPIVVNQFFSYYVLLLYNYCSSGSKTSRRVYG